MKLTLEELLKLVSDEHKEAVTEFVTSLTGKIETLSTEVTDLEKQVNNPELQGKLDQAIAKRDAAKGQLTVVRETLGLPADKEITRELVTDHMSDTSKGDAEKDKIIAAQKIEITTLEQANKEKETKLTEAEAENTSITAETKFIKVFSEQMPEFKAATARARVDIEKLMRVNAVLEDGDIIYKGKDGETLRVEGTKMTMKERLAELQADPELSYLFESKAKGGSGTGNGGTGNVSKFDTRKRTAGIS